MLLFYRSNFIDRTISTTYWNQAEQATYIIVTCFIVSVYIPNEAGAGGQMQTPRPALELSSRLTRSPRQTPVTAPPPNIVPVPIRIQTSRPSPPSGSSTCTTREGGNGRCVVFFRCSEASFGPFGIRNQQCGHQGALPMICCPISGNAVHSTSGRHQATSPTPTRHPATSPTPTRRPITSPTPTRRPITSPTPSLRSTPSPMSSPTPVPSRPVNLFPEGKLAACQYAT